MSDASHLGGHQTSRGKSHMLPSHLLEKAFGKVYVSEADGRRHVEFTIWEQELQGAMAEGWQTGVALDGSASMKSWYGQALGGKIPPELRKAYEAKGWITKRQEDGKTVSVATKQAYQDAIAKGHLKYTENIVQPVARQFIGYLASELDLDGGTTVIYWACGSGDQTEVLGDFTADECETLEIRGPKQASFGTGTCLVPAMKYFIERFADAERGMYLFVTDGRLDDMAEVKRYTTQLAKEIEAGSRHFVKCVLLGVGDEIDESQMQELDDLDTGTEVDIWDHKIAKELRAMSEIIVELVGENRIVAPTATVYDEQGQVVHRFTDGLPARAEFTMPIESSFFELEVGGQRFKQTVTAE